MHSEQTDRQTLFFIYLDYGNHRVMKWMKDAQEGVVVAAGQGHDQGQGNTLKQLSNIYGIVVDQLGTFYVADYGNYRMVR